MSAEEDIMEKIKFKIGRKGDLMSKLKSGKIVFIDRKVTIRPQAGEDWMCEVRQPENGKVGFVTPVRKCRERSEIAAELAIVNSVVTSSAEYRNWEALAACFPKLEAKVERFAEWGVYLQIKLPGGWSHSLVAKICDLSSVNSDGGEYWDTVGYALSYSPEFSAQEVDVHLKAIMEGLPKWREIYSAVCEAGGRVGSVSLSDYRKWNQDMPALYFVWHDDKREYHKFPATEDGWRQFRALRFGNEIQRLSLDELFKKFVKTSGCLVYKSHWTSWSGDIKLSTGKRDSGCDLEAVYFLDGYELTGKEAHYLLDRQLEALPNGHYRPTDAYNIFESGEGKIGHSKPIPPVKGDGWVVTYWGKTGCSRRGVAPEGKTFRGRLGVDEIRQPSRWDWVIKINGVVVELGDHKYSGEGFAKRCESTWRTIEGRAARAMLSEEGILNSLRSGYTGNPATSPDIEAVVAVWKKVNQFDPS
jgi:hypothetical protein